MLKHLKSNSSSSSKQSKYISSSSKFLQAAIIIGFSLYCSISSNAKSKALKKDCFSLFKTKFIVSLNLELILCLNLFKGKIYSLLITSSHDDYLFLFSL